MTAQYLATKQKAYVRFIDGGGAEEGALEAATERTHSFFFAGNGSDELQVNRSYKMGQLDNGVQLAFEFNTAADTAVVEIWAKPSYGDLEFVGTYNLTAGAQVSDRGQYWADTITLNGTAGWTSIPDLVDAGGADRMARIQLDGSGAQYFLCNITSVTTGTLSCYARGY